MTKIKYESLEKYNPILSQEWSDKNNIKPSDVTPFSRKKVWWKCNICKNEWQAIINNRSKGSRCPFCNKRKAYKDNCLANKFSEISKEWHLEKNKLTPYDVTPFSAKKVWWKCEFGHEWESKISTRTNNQNNCPYCSGYIAWEQNCLATKFPSLIKEWHSEKNELTPYNVTAFTKKKVWWKCEFGHEWEAVISDRTISNSGCHICSGYSEYKKSVYTETTKTCTKCDQELLYDSFRIRKDGYCNYYNSLCKKCEYKEYNNYVKRTEKGIASNIFSRKKYDSKSKNLDFDLDTDWIVDKLKKINWKCELTQIPFDTFRNDDEKKTGFNSHSISVDRINPKKGYTKDNVRFILNQVNVFKQNGTDEQMYELAEALIKNRKKNEV
jgi:hypothetical protein